MSTKIETKYVCVQLRGSGGEWCAPVRIAADEVFDHKTQSEFEVKLRGTTVARFEKKSVVGWWASDEQED